MQFRVLVVIFCGIRFFWERFSSNKDHWSCLIHKFISAETKVVKWTIATKLSEEATVETQRNKGEDEKGHNKRIDVLLFLAAKAK